MLHVKCQHLKPEIDEVLGVQDFTHCILHTALVEKKFAFQDTIHEALVGVPC